MTTEFSDSRRKAMAVALALLSGKLLHNGSTVTPPKWDSFDFFWKITSHEAEVTSTAYIAGDQHASVSKAFHFYIAKSKVMTLTMAGQYKGRAAVGLKVGQKIHRSEEPIDWKPAKLEYMPRFMICMGLYCFPSPMAVLEFEQGGNHVASA